jgi:hypothetical protein
VEDGVTPAARCPQLISAHTPPRTHPPLSPRLPRHHSAIQDRVFDLSGNRLVGAFPAFVAQAIPAMEASCRCSCEPAQPRGGQGRALGGAAVSFWAGRGPVRHAGIPGRVRPQAAGALPPSAGLTSAWPLLPRPSPRSTRLRCAARRRAPGVPLGGAQPHAPGQQRAAHAYARHELRGARRVRQHQAGEAT